MADTFVAVAVPAPLLAPLTYRVPPSLANAVGPGVRVRVPLGARTVVGVVIEAAGPPAAEIAVRDVVTALDTIERPALPPDLLATVKWTAEYYCAPPGEVVRAALPSALAPARPGFVALTDAGRVAAGLAGSHQALVWLAARGGGRARKENFVERLEAAAELRRFVRAGLVALEGELTPRGAPGMRRVLLPADGVAADPASALAALARAPARRRVLEAALSGAPRGAAELARAAGAAAGAVAALVAEGLLVERAEERPVDALPETGLPVRPPPELTAAQRRATERLTAALDGGGFHVAVLFGVTGSGKTEVYLRAAEHALARGRGVLVLVPEIGLAPQASESLAARFGEPVVVLHSGMADRQRYEAWHRARDGAARLVVGARSALFAPLAGIGLIVVDEEHDGGYKQDESPRYHARDLALVRGREAGAVVVLGSATPSIEAWTRAGLGQAELLELPERIGDAQLAHAVLVDMREEFRETKKAGPLSRLLVTELEAAVSRGEQAMVLLNRRGWSRSLLCRACGLALECRQCSIALTWHRVGEKLRCHYCGWSRPRPVECPSCASPHLAEVGEGTQQIEDLLAAALPGATVARLDRDAVRSSRRLVQLLGQFGRGEIDVLVGTQMIAKGHHFPRVTLVGVLSADATLHLPDFRAAERTFQLLTQVAGRAGRGERPGTVVVQAFRPEHPALQAALDQDFRAFAARETAAREILRYPPAAALVNLVVRDEDQARAFERASDLAARIRAAGEGHVAVLGPTSAPLARLQGLWRVQVLLRGRKRRRLGAALRSAVVGIAGPDGAIPRWLSIDVDPLDLL